MNESNDDNRRLRGYELEEAAMRLRSEGKFLRDIARTLRVTKAAVYAAVARATKRQEGG